MLSGRRKIKTNYREVTDENISTILAYAYGVFLQNKTDIEYLYN